MKNIISKKIYIGLPCKKKNNNKNIKFRYQYSKNKKKIIFIYGGSQGAVSIN